MLPTINDIYPLVDTTWPAERVETLGPVTLRFTKGAGSRVSSASTDGPVSPSEVAAAEAAMDAAGQPRLFMVRDGQDALDQFLQAKGYEVLDPVWVYAAPVSDLTIKRPPPVTSFEVWPPLASQKEIWAQGGLGPARVAVMERAPFPKTTLLGRINDRPAGTAYVGVGKDLAMLHALEVSSMFRRKGLAAYLTQAAAFWARDNGASHLTLITTQANAAANALYTSLGMKIVGQYHYRIQRGRN